MRVCWMLDAVGLLELAVGEYELLGREMTDGWGEGISLLTANFVHSLG